MPKNLVSFEKVYTCLDDSCKFIIDAELSTSEHETKEMPLTRKKIEFKEFESMADNEIEGYVSTRSIDWSKDVVVPEGVITSIYQKNPTFLFNHDTTKIIGKAVNLVVDDYGVKARLQFAPTFEADDFLRLAKHGSISAFSIGFIPVEFYKRKDRQFNKINEDLKSRYPEYDGSAERIITKWVLLEVSLVATPDNPNAIITQKQIADMEIKSSTLELLNLKCSDCEEASKEFKEAIVKTLEYNTDNNELTLHKFVDRTIKVIAKPISQEVLDEMDRMDKKYNEDMLELKRITLEHKKNLLIELQERKNKQIEQKRLEAILTKKGKLVRY